MIASLAGFYHPGSQIYDLYDLIKKSVVAWIMSELESLGGTGLEADHTTIWRWVQCYGPELEARLCRHLKPTHKSWRVDETYVRVKGRWCYLYRAIDSTPAPRSTSCSRGCAMPLRPNACSAKH